MQNKSDYELKRLERLKRNHQVMKSLGLPTHMINARRPSKPSAVEGSAAPEEDEDANVRRSSSRLAALPRANFKEIEVFERRITRSATNSTEPESEEEELKRPRVKVERTLFRNESDDDKTMDGFRIGSRGIKSCSEMNCKIAELGASMVGKIFFPPANTGAMKETVMKQIAEENPIFSKYSGLQEFRNALIVFANVGGKDYENMFHNLDDGDVAIDWFSSIKVKPDSRVAQRLLNPMEHIFIFLRFEGEPYLGCGKCEVIDSEISRRPMKFRLKLVQTNLIKGKSPKLFDQLIRGERGENNSNDVNANLG